MWWGRGVDKSKPMSLEAIELKKKNHRNNAKR